MSMDADSPLVVHGPMRIIEYAVCSNGIMPARKFIEKELNESERTMLLVLFKRMADHGTVPNREQFKKVEGEIFEFKKHQIRVFCFRTGDHWLLTNGYKKKKDRLDPGEVKRAKRIMAEHLRRGTGRQERRTK